MDDDGSPLFLQEGSWAFMWRKRGCFQPSWEWAQGNPGFKEVWAEGARERENWAVQAPLFFKPWERVLPLCFLMKAFRE